MAALMGLSAHPVLGEELESWGAASPPYQDPRSAHGHKVCLATIWGLTHTVQIWVPALPVFILECMLWNCVE